MTDKNTDAELTAKVAAMTPHGAAEATVGLYCLRFSDRVAVRARDCSESASKLFGVMQAYAIVEQAANLAESCSPLAGEETSRPGGTWILAERRGSSGAAFLLKEFKDASPITLAVSTYLFVRTCRVLLRTNELRSTIKAREFQGDASQTWRPASGVERTYVHRHENPLVQARA